MNRWRETRSGGWDSLQVTSTLYDVITLGSSLRIQICVLRFLGNDDACLSTVSKVRAKRLDLFVSAHDNEM